MLYEPTSKYKSYFVEEFKEDAPLDENATIEILSGQAAQDFRAEVHELWVSGERTDIDVETDLRDWCYDMPYKKAIRILS